MKFGKVLEQQATAFPAQLQVFLRYKLLKNMVKAIVPSADEAAASMQQGCPGTAELLATLNEDIDHLNSLFIEQEEVAVIKMQATAERLRQLQSQGLHHTPEQLQAILPQIMNLHGEFVLLLNWSLINYSGLAKILKKYDKHTRGCLKRPCLEHVLRQPFCSTAPLSQLVRTAESLIAQVASLAAAAPALAGPSGVSRGEQGGCSVSGPDVARHVQQALDTWDLLARSASSPSTILVPQPEVSSWMAAPCPGPPVDEPRATSMDGPCLVSGTQEALGMPGAGAGMAAGPHPWLDLPNCVLSE